MSSVNTLLRTICPGGVEYRALSEVARTVSGLSGKTKADFAGGNSRYVSYKNVFANLGVDQTASDFVVLRPHESQNRLHLGDVIITGSSESVIDVGMSSVVLTEPEEPLYLNSFCFALRLNDPDMLLPEFSKHLFRSEPVRTQIRRSASGVTRINVSKARFMEVRIPVPPIELQRVIASTLDALSDLGTELEVGLSEELRKRQQQYGYYTDSVLAGTSTRNVEWVPLGRLGTFMRGRRFVNRDFVEDGIPCIHYGELYTHYGLFASEAKSHVRSELLPSLRLAQPGDLVVVGGGENVEDVCKAVAWLGESPVAVHDECYIFHHSLYPKYAAYVFSSEAFHREKARYARGAKIVRVSIDDLAKIEVPVPDISEQKRIVGVLDNFDHLVNDITRDIPAEIAARRKQYAYHRDKLLSFDEGSS